MVNDYALYVFSMYSSARVGEYIESSARKGTGRGLKYKVCGLDCGDHEYTLNKVRIGYNVYNIPQ